MIVASNMTDSDEKLDDYNETNTGDKPLLVAEQLMAPGMQEAVDLRIYNQQIWMLIGPSGSGKSQFLKSLADLVDHTGLVSLHGKVQDIVCPEKWRSQVMYFSAETAWWADTVIEHFNKPPTEEYLAQVGLTSEILQASPLRLSSGEKQRLALLRGLVCQPKVLLLDEITANLDETNTLQVEALLQTYLQQHETSASILWVSHDSRQQHRLTTEQTQIRFGFISKASQERTL